MDRECAKCGCQDIKWVEFKSKAGNDVKGWKCQNKACGDLVFAKSAKKTAPGNTAVPQSDLGTLSALKNIMKGVDEILERLKAAGYDLPPTELEVEKSPF